jgi:preprotein translocase subunit SecF
MELDPKKLMFVPIAILAFSAFVILSNKASTGEYIVKDVDLKGGTLITLDTQSPVDARAIEDSLSEKYGSAFVSGLRTSTGYGAKIEIDQSVDAEAVVEDVKSMGVDVTNFSIESIKPALGALFFDQMVKILLVAFGLMSAVIFMIYRNAVSSFGIIFSTGANMVSAIAIANFLGIPMSFAGFAGLLMLIAFTTDTNIVLTTKVLGTGTEDFKKRYRKALITGLTMSLTITAAMLIVPFFTTSKLLINIANILVIGFLVDLIYTWIFNAGLLKMWHERRYKSA